MPEVAVHYLPQFVSESELADRVVVMIDLLRASTTICHALAAGAEGVVPCLEVDETFTKSQKWDRSEIILGGERSGKRIEGFDLGNSPAEYTPENVFGKKVFFTTTNGTKALGHARLARKILIGAAVNRQAVVDALLQTEHIEILCAGTNGQVTREDILAAGAIVEQLQKSGSENLLLNEWAEAAVREWQELETTARALRRTVSDQFALELRETQGGKNLLAIGFDHDLEICSQLDTLQIVPELDMNSGTIYLP